MTDSADRVPWHLPRATTAEEFACRVNAAWQRIREGQAVLSNGPVVTCDPGEEEPEGNDNGNSTQQ